MGRIIGSPGSKAGVFESNFFWVGQKTADIILQMQTSLAFLSKKIHKIDKNG